MTQVGTIVATVILVGISWGNLDTRLDQVASAQARHEGKKGHGPTSTSVAVVQEQVKANAEKLEDVKTTVAKVEEDVEEIRREQAEQAKDTATIKGDLKSLLREIRRLDPS